MSRRGPPAPDATSRAAPILLALGCTAFLATVDAALGPGDLHLLVRADSSERVLRVLSAPAATTDPWRAALAPPCVRVRLSRSLVAGAPLLVTIEGAYAIVAGELESYEDPGGGILAIGEALRRATFSVRDGRISANGVALPAGSVTLLPERDGRLRVGGRRYRGALILRIDANGELRGVNLVDLEDYVAGVVFSEMPERFATEALRAQSVISRSYALYHAARQHELRDDQGSQVYRGIESRDARRIADSTRGEVLFFAGDVLEAYFSSTCGGTTASGRDVFHKEVPAPLAQRVECGACGGAPFARWERRIAPAAVAALYRGAHGDRLGFRVAERDAAGRALTIEVLAPSGAVVDHVSSDRFKNDYNAGRSVQAQLLSTWIEIVGTQDREIVVRGRGFGHGVGLCQYGALGLARAGAAYRGILERYYPAAIIHRIYE